MHRSHRLLLVLAALSAPPTSAALPLSTSTVSAMPSLAFRLQSVAPSLDPRVLSLALQSRDCATRGGAVPEPARLAVIDYSRPSTERRMWVFDLAQGRLLYSEYVAHGRGSGDNLATVFSNTDGSHQTSLGLFETAETYIGGNGYSLRMDGLEPGVNDNARARAIVIHGASYVNPSLALRQGRLGRSYGCPALRPQIARELIDTLKGGQLLFAYYPDRDWLAHSRLLQCHGRAVAAR